LPDEPSFFVHRKQVPKLMHGEKGVLNTGRIHHAGQLADLIALKTNLGFGLVWVMQRILRAEKLTFDGAAVVGLMIFIGFP
jgi:hypothetical protein